MNSKVVSLLLLSMAIATEACSPSSGGDSATTTPTTPSGRKRRSSSSDVVAVIVSNLPYSASTLDQNIATVQKKIESFAARAGLNLGALKPVNHSGKNVDGMFAVEFRVPNSLQQCLKVRQFTQAAVNLPEVLRATVQCGSSEKTSINKSG